MSALAAMPFAESFARAEDAYHSATTLVRTYLVRPAEQRALFLREQLPTGLPLAVLDQVELLLLGVDHSRYQIALVLARYDVGAERAHRNGATP